ncbi:hypothetical protein Gogos_012743 [Gossypium gossypioides]|uniref:RNase H type-1 domain-containing protein n=1 Tax=Gossypium gossypioides TaxID=34282 RepID=A0A7J9BTI4_GOSGO|nr:hypothetical protein [Gossypium gossypioides]
MSTSGNIEDDGGCPADGRITKKVQFKDKGTNNADMSIDPKLNPIVSWKDMFLGNFVDTEKESREDIEIGGNEGLKGTESVVEILVVDSAEYGPWMVIERRLHRNVKEPHKPEAKFSVNGERGLDLGENFNRKGDVIVRLDKEEGGAGIEVGSSRMGDSVVGLKQMGVLNGKNLIGIRGPGELNGSCCLILANIGPSENATLMGSCIVNNMKKVNGDWLLSTPIKNATVEQVVENKLNNYSKRLINSGDLHLNTISHFNLTFESPVELGISLNPNLLDPSKLTTMVFKDNHGDNTTISLEGGDLGISDIGGSITKMCASLGKGTTIRKGRARNKITKDRGEFFGGILIGWKDSVKVEVVYSHPQFVLIQILNNLYRRSILVAFVYGSPNNAILSSNGNMERRREGKMCSAFDNFKSMNRLDSEEFSNIKMKVREELESVLHHEELFWKQKAKYDLLIMGDPALREHPEPMLGLRPSSFPKFFKEDNAYDRVRWEFIKGSLKATADIIIVGKADKNQARLLKGILKDFYNFSEHQMNTRKSNIFFSIGVSEDLRKILSDILGFNRVQNIGSYLGISLIHEKVTNSTLRFVVDRGASKGEMKIALVSWEFIYQPRSRRGLGFWRLEDQNTSFLMKLGFNHVSNSNALWVRVLRSKNRVPTGLPIPKFGPLLNHIPSHSNMERENVLSEMVTEDGLWNLNLFCLWVSEDVIRRIMGIPPPQSKISANLQNYLNLLLDGVDWQCFFVVVPKLGNWIQLNSDKAVKEESGFVMIGGVLRDRYGGCIIGYNKCVGICSVLDFDRVLIVSDSLEGVQVIQGRATKVSNSALVRRINLRVAKLMEWSILHISRNFNKEVDSLAKMDVDNKGRT